MIRLNTPRHDVEQQLVGRHIRCPACGTSLRPWGHDRPRHIRVGLTDRRTKTVIRRRARCPTCQVTHIIQDPRLADQRKDTARVIRHALTLKRKGHGYRHAADQTDRPDSTIRNWYRHSRTHPGWPAQQRDRPRLNNVTAAGSIT